VAADVAVVGMGVLFNVGITDVLIIAAFCSVVVGPQAAIIITSSKSIRILDGTNFLI